MYTLVDCIRLDGVRFISTEQSLRVAASLPDVPFNVHGESRSLRDCQPRVDRDGSRDASEANDETPYLVKGSEDFRRRVVKERVFVTGNNNE